MKFLIKESDNNLKNQILRRLPAFEKALNELIEDDNPCYYDSQEDYIDISVTESFNQAFDYDEDSEEHEKFIYILKKIYSEKLSTKYDEAECDE